MTTIGVISDTHGLLRPEATSRLTGVDAILHAGDIGNPDVIAALRTIAPVTAIKGNIDQDGWAAAYADEETVTFGNRKIFILHNRQDLAFDPASAGIDIVISGHSHKPAIETIDNVLYLNPGSAGPRRFTLPIALATLRISDRALDPEIHELCP